MGGLEWVPPSYETPYGVQAELWKFSLFSSLGQGGCGWSCSCFRLGYLNRGKKAESLLASSFEVGPLDNSGSLIYPAKKRAL